jgi:hypothetical protein
MSNPSTVEVDRGNAENHLTETPTVVICEGDGGIRKGKALLRLAKREGVADRLCMVAINTRTNVFDELSEDVKTIALKTPEERHQRHDKQHRPYLHLSDQISGMAAAERMRRIGRYHIDNPEKIGRYEDRLRGAIEEFVTDFKNDASIDGPNVVNVFQFVAAGGGSGSGIMPFITGMIDTLTAELGRKHGVGFEHWAIVSLASVENFHAKGTRPDVNWRYPANSLALLDELRAITGYDESNFPLRIPILSARDTADIQRSAYTIESNPFSGVFFLRYNEDAGESRRYRKGVNQAAARAVLEWMRKDQDTFDGLENESNDLDYTFYELRAATFQTPTHGVNALLDAQEAHEEATETLETLRSKREELDIALEQLRLACEANSVIQNETLVPASEASGEDERPTQEVLVTAFARAKEIASNIDPQAARLDQIEAELSEHQQRRSFSFHDRVDGELVQRAIFMAAVGAVVNQALTTHRFTAMIREFVEEREETITEFDATFDPSATPKQQFIQTIEPLLSQQVERLNSKLDDLGLTGRVTNRQQFLEWKDQRDRTKSQLETMRDAQGGFEHLTQLAESIAEERGDAVKALEQEIEGIESMKDSVENEISQTKQELSAAEDRIERHEEIVLDSPLGQQVTLPVADGAQLSSDHFDDDPDISTLIDLGVLDHGTVVEYLRKMLRDPDDGPLGQTLETRGMERTPPRGRAVVFCSEATEDLVWQDAPNGLPPKTIADEEFADEPTSVICNDDHQLALMAVYGRLTLDNFDHGTIRESLFREQPTLWGEEIALEDCYAYPELLPPGHPASMHGRVDDMVPPKGGEADD